MKPIAINGTFVLDATRSYVERDPYNQIGAHVINELADTLQKRNRLFLLNRPIFNRSESRRLRDRPLTHTMTRDKNR